MQTKEITGVIERIGPIAGMSDVSYALRLKGNPETLIAEGDRMSMEDKTTWGTTMALSNPGDNVTVKVLANRPTNILGFVNQELG